MNGSKRPSYKMENFVHCPVCGAKSYTTDSRCKAVKGCEHLVVIHNLNTPNNMNWHITRFHFNWPDPDGGFLGTSISGIAMESKDEASA